MGEKLSVIQGSGSVSDRTDNLREAIVDAIHEHGMGMTVASVVGVLAVLQVEITTQWLKDDT